MPAKRGNIDKALGLIDRVVGGDESWREKKKQIGKRRIKWEEEGRKKILEAKKVGKIWHSKQVTEILALKSFFSIPS